MPTTKPRRLPRGRHALPREEVERTQRERLMTAMADVMLEKGFAATSVEDVLKRAVISRQTFYQLFKSKLECFMATFDVAAEIMVKALREAVVANSTPLENFHRALAAYMEIITCEPGYARLFIVEVNAAGPEAVERRALLHQQIANNMALLFGCKTERGRFSCMVIVSAMASLVSAPLTTGELDDLQPLVPALAAHVETLYRAGAFE